jgi:hypothetical protein
MAFKATIHAVQQLQQLLDSTPSNSLFEVERVTTLYKPSLTISAISAHNGL